MKLTRADRWIVGVGAIVLFGTIALLILDYIDLEPWEREIYQFSDAFGNLVAVLLLTALAFLANRGFAHAYPWFQRATQRERGIVLILAGLGVPATLLPAAFVSRIMQGIFALLAIPGIAVAVVGIAFLWLGTNRDHDS